MKQLTRKQAIAFAQKEEWKGWTPREIAEFQLQQDRVCIPIDVYKKALSEALRRPIYTLDLLAPDGLLSELRGESSHITF